ncbi:hypothetical protein ACQ4PT_017876 [Festuca glaucescens]
MVMHLSGNVNYLCRYWVQVQLPPRRATRVPSAARWRACPPASLVFLAFVSSPTTAAALPARRLQLSTLSPRRALVTSHPAPRLLRCRGGLNWRSGHRFRRSNKKAVEKNQGMSLGYAEKLSYREDLGSVGMPEMFDSPKLLQGKIEELAIMVQKSKHLVVFTGAGISTSSGIPDFRGPKGVWTLQRAGKGVPDASLPFHRAAPTLTHMALVELERAGLLKFVISQNVDSLHLRSGFPREKLAELHGNSFKETCPCCKTEYLRDFEIETIGLKDTPRRCTDKNCGARLKDTVLDWEDALPPEEMNSAEEQCRAADLVLCLGTSLQITPACNMPLMSIKNGGKVAIVNLQATPKDKKASLVIHGLVDKRNV